LLVRAYTATISIKFAVAHISMMHAPSSFVSAIEETTTAAYILIADELAPIASLVVLSNLQLHFERLGLAQQGSNFS